jgi:hypothetical protein
MANLNAREYKWSYSGFESYPKVEQVSGTLQSGGNTGGYPKRWYRHAPSRSATTVERFPFIAKRVVHLTPTDLDLMHTLNEFYQNPRYGGYLNRHDHKSLWEDCCTYLCPRASDFVILGSMSGVSIDCPMHWYGLSQCMA